MRNVLITGLMVLLSATAASEQVSLLNFDLKSLDVPEVHSLSRYQGKPVVVVFFQPECNWCMKQVRAINSLHEQYEIEAIAVGIGGNRVALRKELRRLRPSFPAYQASPRLLEELGGVDATPITLFGGSEGEFVNWSSGFLPDQELLELMRSSGIQLSIREPGTHTLVDSHNATVSNSLDRPSHGR